VYNRRYSSKLPKKTFDPKDIEAGIKEWASCLDEDDSRGHGSLGGNRAHQAVTDNLPLSKYLADAMDHNYPRRKKKGEKHDLTSVTSTRGEKVESFHNPLGTYANGGCDPHLAQAVTIEGTVRFDMDHESKAQWNAEEEQDGVPALTERPRHYKRWIMEAANAVAQEAGKPLPYPQVTPLRPDNGEEFYYDYFVSQLEREAEPEWLEATEKLKGKEVLMCCPCRVCTLRRQTCECPVCTAHRAAQGDDTTQVIEARAGRGDVVETTSLGVSELRVVKPSDPILLPMPQSSRSVDAITPLSTPGPMSALVASTSVLKPPAKRPWVNNDNGHTAAEKEECTCGATQKNEWRRLNTSVKRGNPGHLGENRGRWVKDPATQNGEDGPWRKDKDIKAPACPLTQKKGQRKKTRRGPGDQADAGPTPQPECAE